MVKKVLKLAGILFAVCVVAMIAGYLFINSIAKGFIEKAGSAALGTEVTLRAIDIRPLAGHIDFQGLRVANPEGFSDNAAFALEHFSADVDVATVTTEKVIVKEVQVDGLSATWDGLTGENHKTLLKNMKAFVGAGETSEEAPSEEAPVEKKEGRPGDKNVVIKRLAVTNTSVKIVALGLNQNISMPDQELENIGEDGESLNETLLGGYEEFVGAVDSIAGAGGKAIEKTGDVIKGGLDKVKGLFE